MTMPYRTRRRRRRRRRQRGGLIISILPRVLNKVMKVMTHRDLGAGPTLLHRFGDE